MADLLPPTRGHWGEWINYVGKVIVELLRDSQLKYLASLDDAQIIYGFTEEPLSYPNIYVYPVSDPGSTPTISADVLEMAMQYIIIVEGQSPDLVETDDELRLYAGDIIAELLKNNSLTYKGLPTVRSTYLTSIEAEYFPPSELSADIRRWVMVTLVCEKRLLQNTVTA